MTDTKYTRIEYERRFLVPPSADWKRHVESFSKSFEDKYLNNSRLRLRSLTDSDTGRRIFKLNKKAESESPFFRTVSRILLSTEEYEMFDALAGERLRKVRHYQKYRGRIFSVDVFGGELEGLILCETEADGLEDLLAAEPPVYVVAEVTEDDFFTGGALCRITRTELSKKLSAFC
ncbi:MAG: hypothetical protein R2747_08560 [Pyrinomonadaceae bacterium]